MSVNSFENYHLSWKPKALSGRMPKYLELAAMLESDILSCKLLPGTKLPPWRELADYLDINLSTVARAFKICTEKGIISGSVGSGTFVNYGATHLGAVADSSIRLDSMMPETIAAAELNELLCSMLAESDSGELFQYSLKTPDWQLDAARSLLSKVGCDAEDSALLFASGGQNAIAAILAAMFKSGDAIGVDPLSYPGLRSAASLLGIRIVPIAWEEGCMSEAAIRAAVFRHGIKALYLMPDSQNPTACVMSTEARQRIAELANELGLFIIEDGICSLLGEGDAPIQTLAPERTFYILSLSKCISPALRLAYIAAPPQYEAALSAALYALDLSQSRLLTELSARLIVSGKLDSLLENRMSGIVERNRLVDIILEGYRVEGNERSLCRWLHLPDGVSASDIEAAAVKKGVRVFGSEHFAMGSQVPLQGLRLCICTPKNIGELKVALEIIRELLK